jgi:hypothetical protein
VYQNLNEGNKMRVLFTTTKLKKGLALSLLLTFCNVQMAQSAIKPISCETNFGEKSFTIEGNSIAFHKDQKDGRSISSILSSKTLNSHQGFRKTIYKDGFKHLINIKNQDNCNSNKDFLAITSPRGHKLSFPINCSLLE